MSKIIDDMGRICTECKTYKLWSFFSLDKRAKTGHGAKCKECKLVWVRGYQATPDGAARTKVSRERYASSKANKAKAEELKKMRRDPTYVPDPSVYRGDNRSEVDPIKRAARAAVRHEVGAGRWPAAKDVPCAHAFKGNCRGHSQYHHDRGYAPENALHVIPLCIGHHVREHLYLSDAGIVLPTE